MTSRSDDAADRQALLDLLLAEEGIEVSSTAIPSHDPDRPPVLSYAQERMWFLQQFEDDTSSLNVRAAVRLHGTVDAELLRASVDVLVERHDTLRTLVRDAHGSPVLHLCDRVDTPLIVDDVGSEPDPTAAAARILAQEADRTFDLGNEPPFVVRLIRVADDHSLLSLVMHHIASDGRSMQVFFRDLAATYTAIAAGHDPALPTLPVAYVDYAAWQREWRSDALDDQLQYWTTKLGGDLENCELPTDHPRPPIHTVDGEQVSRIVDADVIAALRELGQQYGATLFMTLLASFDVLLDRRIGSEDHTVTVGTPVAGRVRPELEDMVGVFLNTLALRSDLGGDPTFAELVGRVRDDSVDAFSNQDVPFERLLAELQPARDLSRTPFFSVLFNMQSVDLAREKLADQMMGLDYDILEQSGIGAKFDLTVYVDERRDRHGDDVSMLFVYNRNLYDGATIEGLLDQYLALLAAVAADPDRPISTYSLVTDAARGVLPDVAAPLDATWHGSVPHHLMRHGRERPQATALVDSTGVWTYGDLAAASSRLARVLCDAGVARGDVVAIYGHRCASLVWAVTGALGAGAAYTIIDPAYPPARIADYLSAVSPRAFVRLDEAHEPDVIVASRLDELGVDVRIDLPADGRVALPDVSAEPPEVEIGPDDLACVTMTSGSTGEARPVLGRHGSLTHFLPWQSEAFGVGADDRFSMLSGLAHDPIQRDMFWPIYLGASIVVPDPDQIPSPGWIASWLRGEGVTVAHLTPAMGRLLLETPRTSVDADAPIDSLRLAMFIGEPLTRDIVDRLHSRAPGVTVVNLYGTTETQRASGYRVVARDGGDDRSVVPLGRGIPGTQLVVRSAAGVDAGLAEVGEIWMRSPHLALGYLGHPDETAARFVTTPGAANSSDRMYRTGDLGRYLADGSVEFVGRIDDQVQIRGFRVELGDIRAALCRHPSVADAIVVADGRDGEQAVVAYVLAQPGTELTDADLMSHLRERVPAHMIPSTFTPLTEIPLTPNGKLDRSRLPEPAVAKRPAGVAARDSLEHLLVELWQDVLGRSPIGIHDNFFELGGYSLLATRLFALIEDATGERIPVATLFQSPTVAELAETIRMSGWSTEWSSLVPISPAGSRCPLFYVGSYLISVLQLAHLGEELGPDQPLYGLQPRGLDGTLVPDERIEDMAAHYIAEMRTVQPHGPYLVGGHCSGSWVAFEIARQLEAAGDQVSGVLLVDLGPPGIDRPEVSPWRYIWHRIKFFRANGRLWNALKWQAKIAFNRILVRRVGRDAVRNTAVVHAAHHRAHRSYQGGDVECDLILIRTEDTIMLGDREWFLRWDEKTSGTLHVPDPVVGTHSGLLEQPNVKMLATTIHEALDGLPEDRQKGAIS